MTTKAQLLAAAKRIIADAEKKSVKRKTNPAPRIGTKRPKRASQITGQAPTKRLVKRRKANTMEGYFPNPSEIAHAHKEDKEFPIHVQSVNGNGSTATIAKFKFEVHAMDFAKAVGKRNAGVIYKVIDIR